MRSLRKIPKFKSEDAERKFWAKADTSKYFDWSKAQKALFPKQPKSISLPGFAEHEKHQILFIARHTTPLQRLKWLEHNLKLLFPTSRKRFKKSRDNL